jgi:hypothetical protein
MKVLILGDSHSLCWKKRNSRFRRKLVHVTGASAQGLTNENSRLQALSIFREHLSSSKDCDLIFLNFGEVDCNATIWMYKKKYNVSLRKQFFRSIKNYKKFIKREVEPYFEKEKIFLLGPILPTIPTKNNLIQNSKMRRQIDVTQTTRTRITHLFNYHISKLGYNHYTINDLLLNKKTGLIDSQFHNEFNHHINKNIAQKLWLETLPV